LLSQHHSQKVSLDLKDSSQKMDLVSPSLHKSIDTSPLNPLQIVNPASTDLISPHLTEFSAKLFKPRFSKNSSAESESAQIEIDKELKRLKMQNGLLIVNKQFSQHATFTK